MKYLGSSCRGAPEKLRLPKSLTSALRASYEPSNERDTLKLKKSRLLDLPSTRRALDARIGPCPKCHYLAKSWVDLDAHIKIEHPTYLAAVGKKIGF